MALTVIDISSFIADAPLSAGTLTTTGSTLSGTLAVSAPTGGSGSTTTQIYASQTGGFTPGSGNAIPGATAGTFTGTFSAGIWYARARWTDADGQTADSAQVTMNVSSSMSVWTKTAESPALTGAGLTAGHYYPIAVLNGVVYLINDNQVYSVNLATGACTTTAQTKRYLATGALLNGGFGFARLDANRWVTVGNGQFNAPTAHPERGNVTVLQTVVSPSGTNNYYVGTNAGVDMGLFDSTVDVGVSDGWTMTGALSAGGDINPCAGNLAIGDDGTVWMYNGTSLNVSNIAMPIGVNDAAVTAISVGAIAFVTLPDTNLVNWQGLGRIGTKFVLGSTQDQTGGTAGTEGLPGTLWTTSLANGDTPVQCNVSGSSAYLGSMSRSDTDLKTLYVMTDTLTIQTITYSLVAPTIAATASGQTVSITGNAATQGTGGYTYSVIVDGSVAAGGTYNGSTGSVTINVGGSHNVQVRVTDALGVASDSNVVTVTTGAAVRGGSIVASGSGSGGGLD